MQTFLPFEDFEASVRCLDWRRCGKQRAEGKQILIALSVKNRWSSHRATRMWRGYEDALKHYVNVTIAEWIRRGRNNNMPFYEVPDSFDMPPWLGDEDFHATHRARLLYKAPEHYSQFGWTEDPIEAGYLWPEVLETGEIAWTDMRVITEHPRRGRSLVR